MSNIYFMCENCGIETNGITFVNGMKFCAKCYHQIFGKDNQQTEITQLAIQQLEKVKTLIQNAINFEKPNFVEVYDAINKQINDLRGEKDVED